MFGKQIEEAKIKHPNQQVLDVYEPEKDELTAKDFEKLRAMKKGEVKKEEVEGVDEAAEGSNPLKTPSPFDWKNKKSELPTKPGEKAGFDSKKISTGTVYSRRMAKEENEQFDEAAKPNELHVSDAGGGKYKVHAVGSEFADGIKVGEHLTDTHLDDFHEMGGKVKMIKPKQKNVAEGFNKMTPQQRAHEYNLDAAQREMDRRHAEGEDMTGAKIDKQTYQIIKPKKTNEEVQQQDEATYSAKAARAGKDIGKPGKMFAKIAASAAKKYGSEEAGKRVAGAILKKQRMKEDVDQSTSFYNNFEVQLQENYTFGDYLTAAKQLVEDTDAVEMANEMFKAQDTDIFVIESILKTGIQARINSYLDAGLEVSAPKYSIEDGSPSVEYVVTEEDGTRHQYIHFGSIV